jgi:hypothetical protein
LRIAPDELTGAAVVLALFPAALFVTWATTGRPGMRAFFHRAFRWRVSPWWWLTVLLGLPILTVGLALLMGDDLRPVDITSVRQPAHVPARQLRCHQSLGGDGVDRAVPDPARGERSPVQLRSSFGQG